MAGITSLAYRLGGTRRSLNALEQAGQLESSADMLRLLGFRSCHVHQHPDTFASLVVDAGLEAIEASGIDRQDIGTILVYSGLGVWWQSSAGTDTLELFRYPAARIADALGLSHARVLGLSQQGCSGLFSAIDLAAALVGRPGNGAVLCLTGDVLPVGSSREILFSLMTDAAAALLVTETESRNRIVGHHLVSEAGYWDTPAHQEELVAAYFPMAKLALEGALAQSGRSVDEFRWFLPSNVSERSWAILADLLGIPVERSYTRNIARLGHTVSCDHVISLVDMQEQGLLDPGDLTLWFTFGFGASWSTLIVQH